LTKKIIFGAASLTKPVAAYATLQLVDAGELDLDAPLARFAGPVNPEDAASHSITTRHILTHSSGLPNLASPHENGKPIARQRLAAANASGSLQTTATDFGRFLLAALKGERLSESTFRQWLEPVFHVPWATTEHLNLDPIKLDDCVWFREIFEAVMPGTHSAIEWRKWDR
jgi:CubicO group peptidase (beta-lactamase class C family)